MLSRVCLIAILLLGACDFAADEAGPLPVQSSAQEVRGVDFDLGGGLSDPDSCESRGGYCTNPYHCENGAIGFGYCPGVRSVCCSKTARKPARPAPILATGQENAQPAGTSTTEQTPAPAPEPVRTCLPWNRPGQGAVLCLK